MIRFIILISWEFCKGFIRACWVRWEEIWRGERVEIHATSRLRVGSTVRYVCKDGRRRAAVVTRVGDDFALGQCALRAANGEVAQSAYFDPDTKARGTWHWGDNSRSIFRTP